MIPEKPKRGNRSGLKFWNRVGLATLGLGFIILMLLSMGAIWTWIVEGRASGSHYAGEYYGENYNQGWLYSPVPTSTPRAVGPLVTATLQPTLSLSKVLPEGARLVIGSADGSIRENEANGDVFLAGNLRGQDAAVSPDGSMLAYIQGGQLMVQEISSDGTPGRLLMAGIAAAIMPSWSADSTQLSFVQHTVNSDSLYVVTVNPAVKSGKAQAVKLWSAPQIVAPARFNPATNRILIAEKMGISATAFYSIPSDCADPDSCAVARRDIARVDDDVTWADYHPNAASIVYSDQSGNLYLLMTASGDVQPLLVDSTFKLRPTFNQDGSWLAFIDLTDNNRLMVMRMSDRLVRAAPVSDVLSEDWIR